MYDDHYLVDYNSESAVDDHADDHVVDLLDELPWLTHQEIWRMHRYDHNFPGLLATPQEHREWVSRMKSDCTRYQPFRLQAANVEMAVWLDLVSGDCLIRDGNRWVPCPLSGYDARFFVAAPEGVSRHEWNYDKRRPVTLRVNIHYGKARLDQDKWSVREAVRLLDLQGRLEPIERNGQDLCKELDDKDTRYA